MTRQSVADRLGIKPIARIVSHAAHAHAPAKFTTAPVSAMQKALDKAGWKVGDVDLFEVNEAFACVAMIAMRDLGIAHDVLNIHGGACALGHPIGASGARIMATLLSALETTGCRRGLASLCIGGRSDEHTSELQSLMRISYAVFCLKKKKQTHQNMTNNSMNDISNHQSLDNRHT